nr:BREX system Lon protease-like protein BrxL [Aurantimonas sp. VKM B-3413]
MFTSGYGFIVDYLAEILRHLRSQDFALRVDQHFTVGKSISTRDRDAVYKTASGLLRVLFPNGEESVAKVDKLLHLAMECRKRVKDQLFPDRQHLSRGRLPLCRPDGKKRPVARIEEEEYPQLYGGGRASASEPEETSEAAEPENTAAAADTAPSPLGHELING